MSRNGIFRNAFAAALAACFLFLGGPASAENTVGPTNLILCNKTAILAAGPTGVTQMVALATGQTIFVCGWHVTNTAAAGTFAFSSGTGSNCGTGNAVFTPPFNVTSSAPSADHIEYAQIQLPLAAALCVNPSVATISVMVWYSQF